MALSHPGFATAFGRYAGAVAARYPWIDTYLPINEPLTTARFVGLYGFWHPHARSQAVFATALVAQCLAIRAAMDAIRRVRSDARLIVNEDVGRTFATPGLEPIATHANIRRWLTWDLLTGAIRPDHPMWSSLAVSPVLDRALRDLADRPCPPDILGVDHYVTSDRFLDDRVARYHPALRPGPDGPAYVDVEAVRVPDAVGGGMAGAVTDTWDRYRRPLALTEVFLSGEREHQVAWWTEAWETALEARRRGILLEAVTAWAVMGASGWADLLRSTDPILEPGAFEVVGDRLEPRPLAYAVRHTARGGTVPIARPTQGWWRSMDRFLPVETAA